MADAELAAPPPAEIAFVCAVRGTDLEFPLQPSVRVHRARTVHDEAMVLPHTNDSIREHGQAVRRDHKPVPFMLYSCATVRARDVIGYDLAASARRGRVFDGIEVVVHVPLELNPLLQAPATSAFVFSRLGSNDRHGTHFAAHVALSITLTTRPLTLAEARAMPCSTSPPACTGARGDGVRRADERNMPTTEPNTMEENAKALESHHAFAQTTGATDARRVRPRPKMPPVVPLLVNLPQQSVTDSSQTPEPSLAKSIAQLRMDSARRRSEERKRQMRFDTARMRAADEQQSNQPLLLQNSVTDTHRPSSSRPRNFARFHARKAILSLWTRPSK